MQVLLFDRELRASFDLPDILLKQISPLILLTQPVCLTKWLYIEKTCKSARFALPVSFLCTVFASIKIIILAYLHALNLTREDTMFIAVG